MRAIALLLLLPSFGCAVQLGVGSAASSDSPRSTLWVPLRTIGVQVVRARGAGPHLDVELIAREQEGLQLIRGTLGGGWEICRPQGQWGLGWSVGLFTGLGERLAQPSDAGLAFGASTDVVFRIAAPENQLHGYRIVTPMLDLVLSGRGNFWQAWEADSIDSSWEASATAGIRVTLLSDLTARSPFEESAR
jgi:hypothetical protein